MKKLLAVIMSLAMTLSAVPALADEATETENAVKVLINNVPLETDVPAQIVNDRTLVPMRAIFETLGAQVQWVPENKSIFATSGATLIVMNIGLNKMAVTTIGGESKTLELDVPPQIIEDRTLVPVRAISEALGCKVDWDGVSRTVIITK